MKSSFKEYMNDLVKKNFLKYSTHFIIIELILCVACLLLGWNKECKIFLFLQLTFIFTIKFSELIVSHEVEVTCLTDHIGSLMFVILNALNIIFLLFMEMKQYKIVFPMNLSQLNNIICLVFMPNAKVQILLDIALKISFVLIKVGIFKERDENFFLEMIGSSLMFYFLCYFIDKMRKRNYKLKTIGFKRFTDEVIKMLDRMSENLVLLNVENDKKFTLFNGPNTFLEKFYKNKESDFYPEKVFEQFVYVKKEDISNIRIRNSEIDCDTSYNMLNDMLEFVEDKNIINFTNHKTHFYAVKIYDKNDKKDYYEFYEVKFSLFKSKINFPEEKPFLIILLKDIDLETYQNKNQQMTSFGNVLISSLTHELKNPLNSLFGQLYSFELEIDNINKKLPILESLIAKEKTAYTNDIEVNYILNDFSKHHEKIPLIIEKLYNKTVIPIEKIKTLVMCYNLNFYKFFINNVKSSKYLISKMNLIITNFEIFSKSILKLPFNVKKGEFNLYSILKKCFRILYPMCELNNNNMNIDIETSKSIMVKTDIKIFKILIKNIILLFEKRSKNSEIEVSVKLEPSNDTQMAQVGSKANNLKLIFELKSMLCKYEIDNKICTEDSLDVLDIFRKNNKLLSKLINCEYCEFTSDKEKYLKYIVFIKNFSMASERQIDIIQTLGEALNQQNSSLMSSSKVNEDNTIFALNPKKESYSSVKNLDSLSEIKLSSNSLNCEFNEVPKLISPQPKLKSQFATIESCLQNEPLPEPQAHQDKNSSEYGEDQEEKVNASLIYSKEYPPNDIQNICCQSSNTISASEIMIVDDDSLSINYLNNVIKEKKKNTIIATNGKEAYEKIKSILEKIDILNEKNFLIIMDIYMPVMNGIEAAKLIEKDVCHFNQTHNGKFNCQIYFITGNTESQIAELTKQISLCKGYFEKPIKKKDILSLIGV